jgi:hypothetical protein
MKRILDYLKTLKIDRKFAFLAVFVVMIFAVVVIGLLSRSFPQNSTTSDPNPYTRPEWARTKPQTAEKIQDVKAAFPYVGSVYTIYEINGKYPVEYPSYYDRGQIRVLLGEFFSKYGLTNPTIIWMDGTKDEETLDLGHKKD